MRIRVLLQSVKTQPCRWAVKPAERVDAVEKYEGVAKRMHSEIAGEQVSVLKYSSRYNFPYCDCSRCGKPIRKVLYVVQSDETGIELFYLGSECIRKFS